ncbi:tetratricopeptide repeat protein [bacterium]|nr:tetratricopeptide repeat protein [candidate division CSSED10-310 bacterium]
MNQSVDQTVVRLLREGLRFSEREEYRKAIELWEQALALQPDHVQLKYYIDLANRKLTDAVPQSTRMMEVTRRIEAPPDVRGPHPARRKRSPQAVPRPVDQPVPGLAALFSHLENPNIRLVTVSVYSLLVIMMVVLIGIRLFSAAEFRKDRDRAVAAFAGGQLEGADGAFRRCLARLPGSTFMARNHIGVLVQLGRFEQARAAIDSYLHRHGDDYRICYLLYIIENETGNRNGAWEAISRARLLRKDVRKINLAYAKLIDRSVSSQAAVDLLQLLLDEDPGDTRIYTTLADVLAESGRLEEAADLMEEAVRIDRFDVNNSIELAHLHKRLKHYQRSAELIGRILRGTPDSVELHLELAVLYQHLGRLEDALRQCDNALFWDPVNLSAYARKGRILILLKQYTDAEHLLRSGTALDTGNQELQLTLGMLLAATKRYEAAVLAFAAAGELVNRETVTLNLLGAAHRAMDQKTAAIAAYERSLALDPQQQDVERILTRLKR